MKRLALVVLALTTLAGCGSKALMPAAVQGASSLQARADEDQAKVQRQIRALIETRYPALTIKSLVATRDKEVGVALYSYKGVGSYKGQHVVIDGAYFQNQDRLSACYVRDEHDNLITL